MFGFKKIATDGGVFKINGSPVKFKGVNHHDSDPKTGYVMTADAYLKNIRRMKEYNVNAVRLSFHFLGSPLNFKASRCTPEALSKAANPNFSKSPTRYSLLWTVL